MKRKAALFVAFSLLLISSPVGARTVLAGISANLNKGGLQTTFVNEPIEFTVTLSGGTPPYTYQWCTQLYSSVLGSPLGDITEVPGAISPTFEFVSSSTGIYAISVKIWDSEGEYGNIVGLPYGIWVTVKELHITPVVSILSPTNTQYVAINESYVAVPLTFVTNASLSWSGYSLDGGENVTAVNGTLIDIPIGSISLTLYANDSAGNWAFPQWVYYSVARNVGAPHQTPPEPFPWLLVAISAAIAALVAVAAIVYRRNTKASRHYWFVASSSR